MAGELTTTITFADGDQVTSAKLNQIISGAAFTTSAVTGTTLTVTGGKLKVGTITESEMGIGSVTNAALGAGAVTSGKIYEGNVTTSKLADGAVTGAKIAANTITAANLSAGLAATKAAMQAESGGYTVTPDFVKHSSRVTKAHGVISFPTDATRDLMGNSVNVSGATVISTTATRVNITNNLVSDRYTVLVTYETTTDATPQAVSVFDKMVSGFTIKHPVGATGMRLNFVVFGEF